MSGTRLVISGSIAIDRIMNFNGSYNELIEATKLHTLSVSVLVDSLKISRGGVASNIAYSMARLGEKPILLGSVGDDAKDYINSLEGSGVDTSNVHFSHLPTASFSVLTDSRDNQVGGFYPGAMSDAESLSFSQWSGQDILFCVSAHDPTAMRRQVQECASQNLRLFYDVGQQVSNVAAEDLLAGIEAAEVLIVNDYEIGVIIQKTGLSLEQLQAKLPILITTHGKNGSVISGHKVDAPINIGSAVPAQIADPTGAGDAYRAGFLYGYLRQWELVKCGRLGSVIASFVLEQQGTQVDLDRQAIRERYQGTFNEEIDL